MTYPLARDLESRIAGEFTHPAPKMEMSLEKAAFHGLEKGQLFNWVHTDFFHYPHGQTLVPRIARSLNLTMIAPLLRFLDPTTAHNVFMLIIMVLNGFAMYLLARHCFQRFLLALACGLAFQFNPFLLLKWNMGFTQKVILFWIPLHFLFLLLMHRSGKVRYAVAAGAMLFFAYYTYPMYVPYMAAIPAFLFAYQLVLRRRFRTPGLVMVAAAVFCFSVALLDFVLLDRPLSVANFPGYQSINPHDALNLTSPHRFHIPHPVGLPFGVSIISVVLGGYAAYRLRGFAAVFWISAVALILIGGGPYIYFGGERYASPAILFYRFVPMADKLYFPLRAMSVGGACLVLLMGYFCAMMFPRRRALSRAAGAAMLLLLPLGETSLLLPELLPPASSKVQNTSFFNAIRSEPFTGLLHLPAAEKRQVFSLYGFYTSIAGKKMLNGNDNATISMPLPASGVPLAAKREYCRKLERADVGYIIWHKRAAREDPSIELAWLATVFQRRVFADDPGLLIYKVKGGCR